MNLTEEQKQKVAAWIEGGAKIAEIQKRLETEFALRLTYLDTRLLVDDLKLVPKNPAPKEDKIVTATPSPATAPTTAPTSGKVSVTVDQIARPGSLVSGNVTFSDGQAAAWHLDETGRLGLVTSQAGYKPTAEDVKAFQQALQAELQKLGL